MSSGPSKCLASFSRNGGVASIFGSARGIRDLDHHPLGKQAAGDGDDFVARLNGGFFRVHQEIEQHLFNLSRRTQHDGPFYGELRLNFDTFYLPFLRPGLKEAGRDGIEIERFGLRLFHVGGAENGSGLD
jgi:hypothetical protein